MVTAMKCRMLPAQLMSTFLTNIKEVNAMNTIDLTPLFECIIALLCAIITVYVVPWIKSHTTIAQQEQLASVVEIAVYAA